MTFIMLQKIYISNKFCVLSIYQKNPEKKNAAFVRIIDLFPKNLTDPKLLNASVHFLFFPLHYLHCCSCRKMVLHQLVLTDQPAKFCSMGYIDPPARPVLNRHKLA